MTTDDRIANFKYSVLQHAYKHENISSTCKMFNVSRTTYYEWLRRFHQFGYLALRDHEKFQPKMTNRIKPDLEVIIHNYIIHYPTHGPRNIAWSYPDNPDTKLRHFF